MNKHWIRLAATGIAIALTAPGWGQVSSGRSQATTADRARAQGTMPRLREPPVLCRLLIPGLPPERQPPPMDCAAARRQAVITGAEVVVGDRDAGRAMRYSVADERYRRDQALRDAREQERIRNERDREWRDGTWDDRSLFDDEDLRVWPD